mmetsp:Transcript_21359/g.46697  ORF Transcript_21359/g.46697 Transcript_21359/m.46697 type:complete len:90 (-) Transcript_21359:1445-1714(-)
MSCTSQRRHDATRYELITRLLRGLLSKRTPDLHRTYQQSSSTYLPPTSSPHRTSLYIHNNVTCTAASPSHGTSSTGFPSLSYALCITNT